MESHTWTYAKTLDDDTTFRRLDPRKRRALFWAFGLLTEAGLIAGFFDPTYWTAIVIFTALHALVYLELADWRPLVFPAQLRIAYLAWVTVGTFVPGAQFLMTITAIGLAANLLLGYCPLSRTLYFLPWNRDVPMSWANAWRTMAQPPMPGRFRVKVPDAEREAASEPAFTGAR